MFRDLPDRDQELLILVAGEGLGIAEIATPLGRSRDAVSVRPHRDRYRFARALRDANVDQAQAIGTAGRPRQGWPRPGPTPPNPSG